MITICKNQFQIISNIIFRKKMILLWKEMINQKAFYRRPKDIKTKGDQHINLNISNSTLPFCPSNAAEKMWCQEWKPQHFDLLLVLQYINASTFPLQHKLRQCLIRLFVCLFWLRPFSSFLPLVTSTQTHPHTSCCVRSCAHITSWWAFGTVRAVLSPLTLKFMFSTVNCGCCCFSLSMQWCRTAI